MILSAGSISAVEGYGTSFWYFNRQTLYAAAGVVGLVVTARLPYSFWRRAAIPMLLALLPVMLLTLHPALGSSLYGASRWIDLGPITLQPAEFAKLLTICSAAAILSRPWKHLQRPRDALLPLGPLVAVVAGVVLLQKDLGHDAGHLRERVPVVVRRGSPAAPPRRGPASRERPRRRSSSSATAYRRTRFLEAWLNSELDPSGAGWQLRQGLIALGSGGWFGVGLGNSRQKWDYLPNAHSDFVFAVLGEELGLIGAPRGPVAVRRPALRRHPYRDERPDTFGRLLAAGITGWIGLQTLVNLGAVTGLLPITGVPLPFLSFGGTALVVTLAGVGVIASVGLEGVRSAERRHARDRSRSGGGGSGR